MLQISVVICGYSDARWNDLLAAIDSVQRQTMPAHEIIVVIDHNPALLVRLQAATNGVILVENRNVRGISGARNTGISLARGEIVAFMDDDAVADPTWLEYLGEGFSDRSVAGVGGEVRPFWLSGRPAWFPEEFFWVLGCTYVGLPRHKAEVRNLLGANMAFRRELIARTQGFRDGRVGKLSIGQEDDETYFCIRLSKACPDTKLIYTPKAGVNHRIPNERVTLRYFLRRCYSEGLSKRRLSRVLGNDQLGTERTYVRKTLLSGIIRELAKAISRPELMAIGRAAAIVAGLSVTVVGYGVAGRQR